VEQGGRPLQKENAAASDNTPSEPCGAATQELARTPLFFSRPIWVSVHYLGGCWAYSKLTGTAS